MPSSTPNRLGPFPSIVLAATVLAFAMPTGAQVRVGVTSAADGDPLGKPPAQPERVLRVGVDVQASELITTQANDRAHLVFLDGTSLTVGPNAQLTVDRFVYDPNSGVGDLSVNLSRGVLRLVGGKISKVQPVIITTPGATTGIRGGITIVDAQAAQTVSTFMFGRDMTVSGQGQTQVVTRPGYEITTRLGAPPGAPTAASDRLLMSQIALLEGRTGATRGAAQQNSAAVVKVTQGTQSLAAQTPVNAPANVRTGQPTPQPVSWQQWGGGVAYQNPSAVNPAITGGTTALTPGATPTFAQLPTTGSATYNGSFTASSPQGPFGGSVSAGWNFASQNGTFSAVSNGANGNAGSASGAISLIPGTARFAGTLTIRPADGPPTGTGSVNGNFVTTSSSPVGAISGNFTGSAPNGVSGTFNATK